MTKLRLILLSAAILGFTGQASADHAWSNYHWQKGSAELAIPVGDNVDSRWDEHLATAMNGNASGMGWNDSSLINSAIVAGGTTPKTCKPRAGRIEVCNARYGRNGWLGIAQIWLSGGHISQGVTKLNDSYFDTATYNKPEWRRLVTCQEIGHDYGLGHTDETFNNRNDGTCMDYTNAPQGGVVGGFDYGPNNQYVNQHDLDQLAAIYDHTELAATDFGVRNVGRSNPPGAAVSEAAGGDSPAEWGRAIGRDGHGRPDMFELDLCNGRKKITHVFWAIGEGPKGGHHHADH